MLNCHQILEQPDRSRGAAFGVWGSRKYCRGKGKLSPGTCPQFFAHLGTYALDALIQYAIQRADYYNKVRATSLFHLSTFYLSSWTDLAFRLPEEWPGTHWFPIHFFFFYSCLKVVEGMISFFGAIRTVL